MTSATDIWEWIRTPLEQLRRDLVDSPDKSWQDRRAELLEQLGLRDESQYPAIKELLEKLDQLSDSDRTSTINSDSIETTVKDLARKHAPATGGQQTEPAVDEGYDEQAWQSFLTQHGPSWNGQAESWNQFTTWFLYNAEQAKVKTPATGLIDYLTGQSPAERIPTFAQYGVTIPQAANQSTTQSAPTAAPATGSDDDIMAEILAANPDLADIPEERRRAIMTEIFGETQHRHQPVEDKDIA